MTRGSLHREPRSAVRGKETTRREVAPCDCSATSLTLDASNAQKLRSTARSAVRGGLLSPGAVAVSVPRQPTPGWRWLSGDCRRRGTQHAIIPAQRTVGGFTPLLSP